MSEYVIECDYDVDEGLLPGEVREEIVRCRDCLYVTMCATCNTVAEGGEPVRAAILNVSRET